MSQIRPCTWQGFGRLLPSALGLLLAASLQRGHQPPNLVCLRLLLFEWCTFDRDV
jgi:hypothetical protein